ncbi:hypothetical protein V6N13_065162 [Hibiscus sabdariffa]
MRSPPFVASVARVIINIESGEASELKQLNIYAWSWESFEYGQDIHMQVVPSQYELLFRNYKVCFARLESWHAPCNIRVARLSEYSGTVCLFYWSRLSRYKV